VSSPECVERLPYNIMSKNDLVATVTWNQDDAECPCEDEIVVMQMGSHTTLTRAAAGELAQVLLDFAEGRIKWEKCKCVTCDGTGRAPDRFEATGFSNCDRCDATGEEIVMAWYAESQEVVE
jgi:hypothetical protein